MRAQSHTARCQASLSSSHYSLFLLTLFFSPPDHNSSSTCWASDGTAMGTTCLWVSPALSTPAWNGRSESSDSAASQYPAWLLGVWHPGPSGWPAVSLPSPCTSSPGGSCGGHHWAGAGARDCSSPGQGPSVSTHTPPRLCNLPRPGTWAWVALPCPPESSSPNPLFF